MSEAQVYLDDDRPARVAEAKRKMDTRAYRDGQISRVAWERTMRASDRQLFEQRQADHAKNAAIRKRLAQQRLQRLQAVMLELENEGVYTKRANSPRNWRE